MAKGDREALRPSCVWTAEVDPYFKKKKLTLGGVTNNLFGDGWMEAYSKGIELTKMFTKCSKGGGGGLQGVLNNVKKL